MQVRLLNAREIILDSFLVVQIANLLLILCVVLLPLISLWHLRARRMDNLTAVLWVLIILLVPILGSLAYFIVGANSQSAQTER